MPLIHYLIVFDHGQQRRLRTVEFRDADEAATAYAQLELGHRGDTNLEIVLIGADSLESIRQTHGNYFVGEDAEAQQLAGASG